MPKKFKSRAEFKKKVLGKTSTRRRITRSVHPIHVAPPLSAEEIGQALGIPESIEKAARQAIEKTLGPILRS